MKIRNISIFALAIGLLCLVSCNKEQEGASSQRVFTASMERGNQKTYLYVDDIFWKAGDSVVIFNKSGNGAKFTAQTGGSTETEFTGGPIPQDGCYYAVYPYASDIVCNAAESELTNVVIPTVQTAVTNGFDPRANVMVARSINTSLYFKHVCSYVEVKTNAPYKEIWLFSNGPEALSGTFSVTMGDDDIPVARATDGRNYVKLVAEKGNIPAGTYVIAVAPQTLASGFSVDCVTENKTGTGEIYVKSTLKGVTVTFDRHYLVKYSLVSPDWTSVHDYVDLGTGVKWATCNVDTASTSVYSHYFAWGETTAHSVGTDYTLGNYKFYEKGGKYNKYNGTDGKTVLESVDDAATSNWHGGWRMPVRDELERLLTCNMSISSGGELTFSSNGKSIAFPCEGYKRDKSVTNRFSYWSSSLDASGYSTAYCFDIPNNDIQGVKAVPLDRCYGLPVRAVHP